MTGWVESEVWINISNYNIFPCWISSVSVFLSFQNLIKTIFDHYKSVYGLLHSINRHFSTCIRCTHSMRGSGLLIGNNLGFSDMLKDTKRTVNGQSALPSEPQYSPHPVSTGGIFPAHNFSPCDSLLTHCNFCILLLRGDFCWVLCWQFLEEFGVCLFKGTLICTVHTAKITLHLRCWNINQNACLTLTTHLQLYLNYMSANI